MRKMSLYSNTMFRKDSFRRFGRCIAARRMAVIDCLRELLFILVTDFHVLVVDIIAVYERKIAVCDHRTETLHSSRESQSAWRSSVRLGTAGEKFHAQLPDLRRSRISVQVAVVRDVNAGRYSRR